jgi:hypothetical protein
MASFDVINDVHGGYAGPSYPRFEKSVKGKGIETASVVGCGIDFDVEFNLAFRSHDYTVS